MNQFNCMWEKTYQMIEGSELDEIVGGMGSDDKLIGWTEFHGGPEILKSKRNGATIVNIARISQQSHSGISLVLNHRAGGWRWRCLRIHFNRSLKNNSHLSCLRISVSFAVAVVFTRRESSEVRRNSVSLSLKRTEEDVIWILQVQLNFIYDGTHVGLSWQISHLYKLLVLFCLILPLGCSLTFFFYTFKKERFAIFKLSEVYGITTLKDAESECVNLLKI